MNTHIFVTLNTKLHDPYSSPTIVQVMKSRMRWVGHVACMGEGRCVYMILVGKPEGYRPLGGPRHISEDNIKMDLQEVWGYGLDWAGSGYSPVAGACEHSNEPSGSIKCGVLLSK
jgi:hypothetical protein